MGLTPWQLLLWIAGFELITFPLLAALVASFFNGYFRAKEQHTSNMANAVGEALKKTAETIKKNSKEG